MDTPLSSDQADVEDPERHRARLFGAAYRMLGDAHEAEDLVQEAYLRWHRTPGPARAAVAAPEGWLVAVVTRLAIDRLRRAQTEQRAYVGPWLPEPIATPGDVGAGGGAAPGPAPDRAVELASDLSVALLVLLERLAPEERAAFLLRDVFDAPYADIARTLERGEAAARQMVHRARARVRAERARFAVPPAAQERLLRRFVDALAAEDRDALLALFAEDATLTSDGGGKVAAARNVLAGPERVTRFLLGLARKWRGRVTHALVPLNGCPAVLTVLDGRVVAATAFATDGARILAAYRVLNPDKLRRVGAVRPVLPNTLHMTAPTDDLARQAPETPAAAQRRAAEGAAAFDRQPTLAGELLTLRPLRPDDFEALYGVAADPLLWAQHPARDRYQEPVFRRFFDDALASGGALVALDRRDGRVIGSSRYHAYDPAARTVEIGWSFLARPHWGGRYNGEMKRLMLAHAFPHVDRVHFVVGRDNARSRRAMEKLGGVVIGTADCGALGEHVVYAITAESFAGCDMPDAPDGARPERAP